MSLASSSIQEEESSFGAQDCRTCQTRRIACDRGLPGCFKCSKKGLPCPGYERNLRWANGIAVRGRLKGLKRPPSTESVTVPKSRKVQIEAARATPSMSDGSGSQNGKLPHSWAAGLDISEIPTFPDNSTIELLLEHYDKKILRLMVWLDSEENGYRRLVLPLARQQPVLLLSILAVSGNHMARTSGIESKFPKSACEAAVAMITQQVQQVTTRLAQGSELSDEIDTTTAEWMLASMLTLSMYGMVESDSMDWLSHRQAARTLVKVLGTTDRAHSELYRFLRNMLSVDDVLASTTSFDLASMNDVILPENEQTDVLFGDYLKMIHRVTTSTRPKFQRVPPDMRKKAAESMTARDVRNGFELARGSTLIAFGKLHTALGLNRRDFIRMTDAYHHAGLLYSYRCLQLTPVVAMDSEYSSKLLYEALDGLEDIPGWAHYMPWPAFILGTESQGKITNMDFLRKTYQSIIEHMGFSQFATVLRFLEEFWVGETDWLTQACEWNDRGLRLLVV